MTRQFTTSKLTFVGRWQFVRIRQTEFTEPHCEEKMNFDVVQKNAKLHQTVSQVGSQSRALKQAAVLTLVGVRSADAQVAAHGINAILTYAQEQSLKQHLVSVPNITRACQRPCPYIPPHG